MKRFSYTILITFCILTLIGLALVPRLPVQLNPSRQSSTITVKCYWPGVSPEVMEALVTTKLEGAFSLLGGVAKVKSISAYGSTSIILETDKKANLDQLRFETAMLIRRVYSQMPKEVSYPVMSLNSPDQADGQQPLLILQLDGNANVNQLLKYAEEQITTVLATIEGVYQVQVNGGNKLEWVLSYDEQEIAELDLLESEIAEALQSHLRKSNLGVMTKLDGSQMSVALDNYGVSSNLPGISENELWKVPVKKMGDRVIYLKDIMRISRQEQRATNFYRVNSKYAVYIDIMPGNGANHLALAAAIKKALPQIRQNLPESYQLDIEYDSTEFIWENLQKIMWQTGAALLILLMFVLLTSLSIQYTLLIVLALVVNLTLSFILIYVFKAEIHLYSLAAITTSLGMIIDNTIVMIDHYKRYRNLKVFTALLGATLTTIAGLSVIYFLPEAMKVDLLDFAVVLIITLVVSLVVALFFIPALMERLNIRLEVPSIRRKKELRRIAGFSRGYAYLLRCLLRYRKTALLAALLAFGLPVFTLPKQTEGATTLGRWYNQTLGSEWYTENVKPFVNKAMGGTLRLFVQYVFENSSYSQPERTALFIIAGLPNHSTLEQMNDVMQRLEEELRSRYGVDKYITRIHSGQNGMITVYFTPEQDHSSLPYELKTEIVSVASEMSGINWNIFGVGEGFSQNSDLNATPTFRVAMYGYNYQELERQSIILKQKLEAHARIQEVDINKDPYSLYHKNLYEYTLRTNAEQLALSGVSNQDIYTFLKNQNIHSQSDFWQIIDGSYEPVRIIPTQSNTFSIWQLMHQGIRLDSQTVKLKEAAAISKQTVTPQIYKEDQQYLRIIGFEYFGSQQFGEKVLEKTLAEMEPVLPLGYTAKKLGYSWGLEQTQHHYGLILVVIALIYVICAVIFESLLQPLALILLIPLSFIGVFLSFYWFDFKFDQGGYASFVLLSGNVVCAAIFIIAEYNYLRKRHPAAPALRIYLKAYNHKIIPVLLAILSTVLGLAPFLFYGQKEAFWFALGVGTIGGLIMSLVVIILYLPLFLKIR